MSSTNKTTYYKLSQYIGTDKPTFLGDYNADMSKIDAGIHAVQETATTANQTAGSAETIAQTALGNTKTNATDIKNIQSNVADINASNVTRDANISKAQSDATKANDSAVEAKQSASNLSANVRTWEDIPSSSERVSKINRALRLISINYLVSGSGSSDRRVLFTIPNFSTDKEIIFTGDVVSTSSGIDTIAIDDFKIKKNGDVVYNDENSPRPYTFYGCRLTTMLPY
jgi:hypothetical protein